jgi:hypothetical protein
VPPVKPPAFTTFRGRDSLSLNAVPIVTIECPGGPVLA